MKVLRVLAFADSFEGKNSSDLDAHIFEEYMLLGNRVNLNVISESNHSQKDINIKLIKVPKISKPFMLKTITKILAYSFATIKNRNQFDIVYTRGLGLNFLICSIIAKKILKKKIIFLISESRKTHKSFRARFFRPFLKDVLKNSDFLVSSSEELIQEIDDYLIKVDRTKLIILHEAVDIEKFKPEKKTELNKLLTVARIDPVKGIETIIKSIPYLIKEIPELKLKLVGSHPNKKYLNNLKNLVLKLNCQEFVDFIGPIPHNDLPSVYNSSKIFILTSKTEASSISTLEAMSCGLPVIVTNVGGMPSLITDGENGFIIEPNEPKYLAEKIMEILRDPSLSTKLGTNARKKIEAEYNWDRFIDGLIKIFNK